MHHVAVIDPGVRVPELDCYNRISRASPLPTTYHLPAMFGLDSLRRVEAGLAAVILLGSGASVHDPLDWVQALRRWMTAQVEAGTPTLGLCFGHQLLADILGGEVGWMTEDHRKSKGLREVTLDADRLWGPARRGLLLVSHAEIVTRLPADCRGIGRSPEVAIEAFTHETLPVWGLQAHPEATPAFAHNNGVPLPGSGDAAGPDVFGFGHAIVDAFLGTHARPNP